MTDTLIKKFPFKDETLKTLGFVEVTDTLIKKFPFKDETLKTLGYPEKRDNVQAEDGNYVFVFLSF